MRKRLYDLCRLFQMKHSNANYFIVKKKQRGGEAKAMRRLRHNTRGQFVIAAALLIALLTLSVSISINEISLQRQELRYKPVRELVFGITSDLERALTYALSNASRGYYDTSDLTTAIDEGNSTISRWMRSVTASYAHLGLKLDVSVNSFMLKWWTQTAFSQVDVNLDLDVDGYGFKGWSAHSAKYITLNIFPEYIDLTQSGKTVFKFQITQSSLSQDEGVPIPNLTNASFQNVFIRVNGTWARATENVTSVDYLGGGNYSTTLNLRVNGQAPGILLAVATPEDNIIVCASYLQENFVNFQSEEENLGAPASENLGTMQLDTTLLASLPQNLSVSQGYFILKYEPPSSDYAFSHWITEGDVAVANPLSSVTALMVNGSGNATAYYERVVTKLVTLRLDSRQLDSSTVHLGYIVLDSIRYSLTPPPTINVAVGTHDISYERKNFSYYFVRWEPSAGIFPADFSSVSTTVDVTQSGSIIAVYSNVTVPPPPPATVALQSKEATQTSTNLGTIELAGITHSLPSSVTVTLGTYSLEYIPATGFVFVNWTTTGKIAVTDPSSSLTSVTVSGSGTITAFYRGCIVTLNSRQWEEELGSNLGQTTLGSTTYGLPKYLTGLPRGEYVLRYTPFNESYVFMWWEVDNPSNVIVWNSTSQDTTVTLLDDGQITAVYDFMPEEPPPPPPPGPWNILYVDARNKIVPPYMWSGKNSHLPSRASTGLGKQEVILTSPPSPTIYLARFVTVTAYIRPNPPNAPMRLVELELGFSYNGQYYRLGYAYFNVTTPASEVYQAQFDTQFAEFTQEFGRGVIPEGSTIILSVYVTFVAPPGGTFFLFYGPNRPSNIQLF